MKHVTKKIILDVGITIALFALMVPKLTGLSLHEWGGLFIGLAFAVHILLNWKWVLCVTKTLFTTSATKARVNYILDALLLAGFTLIILSGMAIAKTIDFTWLNLPGDPFFWKHLHGAAAMMTFLAAAMHVGLHWQWVLCQLRKTQEVHHG